MSLAALLTDAVEALHPHRRVLVAVDGPDCAGKTTLAAHLRRRLVRPVVPVSVDDWHLPRAVRLRRGPQAPEGCYRDSFDLEALTARCLVPFAGGAATVVTAAFDHLADRPADRRSTRVPGTAVLLVEGLFLLRPELRDRWDLAVHLLVPDDVVLARAVERDAELMGGAEQVRTRYLRRYLPAQALYRAEAAPVEHAHVVVDHRDVTAPVVLRGP